MRGGGCMERRHRDCAGKAQVSLAGRKEGKQLDCFEGYKVQNQLGQATERCINVMGQ